MEDRMNTKGNKSKEKDVGVEGRLPVEGTDDRGKKKESSRGDKKTKKNTTTSSPSVTLYVPLLSASLSFTVPPLPFPLSSLLFYLPNILAEIQSLLVAVIVKKRRRM